MIREALNALEEKADAIAMDPTQNNTKGFVKCFGIGALQGLIESATIIGGTVLLLSAAGAVLNAFTPKEK